MNDIVPNKIFNPEGNDNTHERTIIKWSSTGLFNLNNTKYARAKSMYTVMIGNFRVPEKVSGLGEDSIQYKQELSEAEKKAYDGILSFLIFLDSIQTVHLPHISDFVTAPEVQLLLAIQTYQESIHSQSYATILETVVESKKRDDIYYFRRNDPVLLERNKYIGDIYQRFIDTPNDENFFTALVGNYILEWLYFYNGFAFFDTLADQQKMKATDRMINYIRRDELTHVTLFANIFNEIKREFPEMFKKEILLNMFKDGVEQEIKRAQHILWDNIIGMNKSNIQKYTRRLANERLKLLWLEPLYPEATENPYKHLDRIQEQNAEKSNFFESTVTNYTQSSSMKWGREF